MTHTHRVQILLKDSVFILSHTVQYPTVCQSHSCGEDSVKHTSNTLVLCDHHSILVLLAFSCPRVMFVHTQICPRQMTELEKHAKKDQKKKENRQQ